MPATCIIHVMPMLAVEIKDVNGGLLQVNNFTLETNNNVTALQQTVDRRGSHSPYRAPGSQYQIPG